MISIWLQKSASIQPRTSRPKFVARASHLNLYNAWSPYSQDRDCERCRHYYRIAPIHGHKPLSTLRVFLLRLAVSRLYQFSDIGTVFIHSLTQATPDAAAGPAVGVAASLQPCETSSEVLSMEHYLSSFRLALRTP